MSQADSSYVPEEEEDMWHVVVCIDGQRPYVASGTQDEVIAEVKAIVNSSDETYAFIFRGDRIWLTKGPLKCAVVPGKRYPTEPEETGKLIPLYNLLPERPEVVEIDDDAPLTEAEPTILSLDVLPSRFEEDEEWEGDEE